MIDFWWRVFDERRHITDDVGDGSKSEIGLLFDEAALRWFLLVALWVVMAAWSAALIEACCLVDGGWNTAGKEVGRWSGPILAWGFAWNCLRCLWASTLG